MSVENQEERALEVLNLPPNIDQELLVLYFENKRRSGGGPLVSVEKRGDRAKVVFEEIEAAGRVLSKEVHSLQNADLRVRRPPRKDRRRLLLRGIGASTSVDLIELYVENTLGLNLEEYRLYFPPARDSVLVQLRQPLSQDFQTISAKISRRLISGASLTVEEVEQTDSVLVGNLHPSTSPEMLSLYMESRGGNPTVMAVTKLSENTAKVSFVDYGSVDLVLAQPHKLKGADLEVSPYFDFLQPTPPSDALADSAEEAGGNEPSSHMALEIPVETSREAAAAHGAEDLMEEVTLTNFISIADQVKLQLFQLGNFQREIKKTHPGVTIQVGDNGVHIEAADQQVFERVKDSLLQHLCQMAEVDFIMEPEEAQFLDRTEVKERLQRSMSQTPAAYVVSGSNVVVTALSSGSAHQACGFVKSQLAHVSVPMDSQYKCVFPSYEWFQFLQMLSLASVRVSVEDLDVLTLKGMESEMQTVVTEFLASQLESEVVVCMEPHALKYIQAHCHRLLVDMDQVSVIPLESVDVSGFKIYGHPVACSTAKEVLQGIVSSVCTKTITVSSPGITRYLLEEDCAMFLREMEEEFQVYITVDQQLWEPPAEQDFFHAAWALMSTKNFNKVSADALKSDAKHNNQGLLESAKKVIAAFKGRFSKDQAGADQHVGSDDMSLHSAEKDEDQAPDATGAGLLYTNESVSVEDEMLLSPEDLEEEANLSLAIQYSMDSSQSSTEEEKQLQKALMLSKETNQYEVMDCAMDRLNEANSTSLEKAFNTLQLHVWATSEASLLQVDVAFKKRISQKQVVEKLDHRGAGDMTEYSKKCLEAIERKHGVGIQTEGTIINIFGFSTFVSQACRDVQLLLSRMCHSPSDQEILQKVQWVFNNPVSFSITPYSPDVIVFLENAWRMKMRKIGVLLDNQPHIISFREMLAYNTASGESVIISRETINTEVTDENHTNRPGETSLWKTLPSATKVEEDSNEFHRVTEAFNNSICGYKNKIQIVQVDKLVNRLLYHQYQLKRMSVQQASTRAEFEKTLYHGTSEESVKEICLHGFNRSFSGKNATSYGQGVYFAVKSAISLNNRYSPPNADGHKFVFVSRVLTGDYTKGCSWMKAAPLKESSDATSVPFRYDSVTDNMDNPEIFVIFNDTQAFPQYLITCKTIRFPNSVNSKT